MVGGKLLRHEADLDHRAHSFLQQTVVDLINIGEVVHRVAVLVFVIDFQFVMQYGVAADVTKSRCLCHFAKIAVVSRPQGKCCAARVEHLLPKVGNGVPPAVASITITWGAAGVWPCAGSWNGIDSRTKHRAVIMRTFLLHL